MSQIDRVGSFRGKVVDRGVGESSGGFPQAILQLQASEMYDTENGVWVEWPYEEREAITYMVMFGKNNKPTLSARQLMKALGWDGVSFLDLQENEKLNDQIQWRMEENTYEGNTTIRCQWIDAYDAVPGKRVQKLEKADVQRLQAKYAAQMQALSGGPKPKSAPAAKPEAPKADPPGPAPPTVATSAESPTPEVSQEVAPPTAPTPAPEPPKTKKGKPVDMNAAWKTCFKAGATAGKTDVETTQIWTKLVTTAGGQEAVGEDWSDLVAQFKAALS